MNIEQLYSLYLANGQKITTDSRKIEKGQLFFALKGENFDGNIYAKDSIQAGAKYAIVDDISLKGEKNMIYVEHVLKTMQDLALYHRKKLNIPLLAITGSNGKTTTKELIKEVLSKKFKVAYTKGNLNNHIGIPLTLLDIKAYEDVAIIEMGANHKGEIEEYCTYVEPNFGLICNIGKAHLEGFGGIEGIIKGKTELYRYLQKNNGIIFINKDDEILQNHSQGIKSVFYSIKKENEIQGKILPKDSGYLSISINESRSEIVIDTQLTGEYNAYNVLAAYTIGRFYEISQVDIKFAIEHYTPNNSRSQIIKKDSHTVIMDAYNANPSSMEVALINLSHYKTRKVAILGAMKELGDQQEKEHILIAQIAVDLKIDEIILIGIEFYKSSLLSNNISYFETTKEANLWYSNQIWNGETVLIKGSRSMALENILN